MTSISPGIKYILLETFFFALMNIGVKYLDRIPAHEIVFFRALVTLVAGYILIRRQGISPWGNNRRLLLARGAAGTAALVMFFYTIQQMPLASAVTIQYLSPIFTIAFSSWLLRESAAKSQWLLFLVSFAGVLLVKGFDARVDPWDMAIGIVAAAGSGLAYSFVRQLKESDHPLVVVFYFPVVTVPIVGAYTVFHWVTPESIEWVLLLGVGAMTTIAQVFLTKAYHSDRAANISNFSYLGVVYAIVIGYTAFGEELAWMALAGMVLIVGSVFLSSRYRQAN